MNTNLSSNDDVTQYLRECLGSLRIDSKAKELTFNIHDHCVIYPCTLAMSPDESMLVITVTVPVIVSAPKMREQVSEVLCRANQTVNGNFNFELPKGQLSFRREMPMCWIKLDKSFIGLLIHDAVSICDTYFPALMRVLYGGHTPEDAVFLSELEIHSESVEDDANLVLDDADATDEERKAYLKRRARELSILLKDYPPEGPIFNLLWASEAELPSAGSRADSVRDHDSDVSGLQKVWQTIRRLRAWLLDEHMVCFWVMVMNG